MDGWQIVVVSVVVPALITAGIPYLSTRMKARADARLADADIAFRLRDELRADNEALRARVQTLEGENGQLRFDVSTLQGRVTRLEDALRRHGHEHEIGGVA